MKWIDEMFVNMAKDRAAASARRTEKSAQVARIEPKKTQAPGTLNQWNALISSITKDVNEFNNHKMRAGQTPARISQTHFQCEVHLPGMQGQSLVLSLNNNDLQVSVRPEFPKQQRTIAMEIDADGQHAFWVLGGSTKEDAKLSDQQLSEYLLKPVLSTAAVN
jgi:hypothetical protein